VSGATHARICGFCGEHFENVGKQPLQQSGKYRVNENDEENFRERIFASVIPGRCASIELWCAIAHLRTSRFPDAQLRI
jgi:hypothetical protein